MAEWNHKKGQEIEILAPAGSYETFRAVIRAGADAVYLGGSQFGARAYANNFGQDELLRAIDYAHIHGRKVYLTVNTLFKEEELEGALYEYLLPYYRHGLDAVIVQDAGAFSLIRSEFADLDIHASTQMTVTGCAGAAYLKELGASRVVTAREMSFAEIRKLHEKVDVEIESFVHGALCYCYSGQCLFSSMLGGRSGNRGRCAQPCRLPYEVLDAAKRGIRTQGNYVLSPKDLCTVRDIPLLSESGIYSFKIEGRMKQAEYAAGVVSVYRAYTDRYLELLDQARRDGRCEEDARALAKERFVVSEADWKKLLALGNRSGFTNGYYYRKNGADMITFGKPNHAKANEALQEEIREKYVRAEIPDDEIKEKINGILRLKKDFPATIELNYSRYTVHRTGDVVQPALKQPLSMERVEACMKKTGSTPFAFAELAIEMDDDIFMPVQALNQLRRDALDELEKRMTDAYQRGGEQMKAAREQEEERRMEAPVRECRAAHREKNADEKIAQIIVSVETREQLTAALHYDFVDCIYLDSSCYDRSTLLAHLTEDAAAVRAAGKQVFFILPAVFRNRTADFYRECRAGIRNAGLSGVVVKSLDALAFYREAFSDVLPVVLDHSIYIWNGRAKELFAETAPLRDTVPLELNRREIAGRDNRSSEMLIYGNLPLMTTAQCVHANTGKCDKKKTVTYLKDRYGKYFPVKNNCAECYNVLYNTTPLLLFGYREELKRMGIAGYRLAFTTEDKEKVRRMLELCKDTFLLKRVDIKDAFSDDYTNGHYKRGVE